MLDTMRNITFRVAVTAGKDKSAYRVTNAPQRVAHRGSQMQSIYVTDLGTRKDWSLQWERVCRDLVQERCMDLPLDFQP
jgi:hypothetical protein